MSSPVSGSSFKSLHRGLSSSRGWIEKFSRGNSLPSLHGKKSEKKNNKSDESDEDDNEDDLGDDDLGR